MPDVLHPALICVFSPRNKLIEIEEDKRIREALTAGSAPLLVPPLQPHEDSALYFEAQTLQPLIHTSTAAFTRTRLLVPIMNDSATLRVVVHQTSDAPARPLTTGGWLQFHAVFNSGGECEGHRA